MVCPRNKKLGFGGTLAVVDRQQGTRTVGCQADKDVRVIGRLAPGGYAAQLPCGQWSYAFFAAPDSDFTYSATLPKDWKDREWEGDQLYVGLGRPGQPVKAGEVFKYRFATALFYDPKGKDVRSHNQLAHTAETLNMAGGQAGYPVKMEVGSLGDGACFFTAEARAGEAAFALGPQQLIIELPIKVHGLEDNGCAAVYSMARPWFRFVPVHQGTAYFQEPIEAANPMWVGNLFLADNKQLKLTAVIDGHDPGVPPLLEIHNPTHEDIEARVWSPDHTPKFGRLAFHVEVPAGDSRQMPLDSH